MRSYATPISAPAGYPPPQRFNFPPPPGQQQQQPQNSPYFDYAPSTPRPVPPHQTSSSAESTPILHSVTVNSNTPLRKSTSSSDGATPYHHASPMDETSPYHQQQQPSYINPNQMKPQGQQQLLPRGMPPRPQQQQLMPRFPQQETNNFVRTPSSAGAPGQAARFIFTSSPNQQQQQQQQQQATHYVQYTPQGQGQHTIILQQGTNEAFQRMVCTRQLFMLSFSRISLSLAGKSFSSAHAAATSPTIPSVQSASSSHDTQFSTSSNGHATAHVSVLIAAAAAAINPCIILTLSIRRPLLFSRHRNSHLHRFIIIN